MLLESGRDRSLCFLRSRVADRVYYGGQAVIEGVMMRGRKSVVTAVRCPDGVIVADVQPLSALFTGTLRKIPCVRGIIVLIEAMLLGTRALLYSANVSLEEEDQKVSSASLYLMLAAAMALAVVIFFFIPLMLTRLIEPAMRSSWIFNLTEGAIRLVIFVVYLKLVGRLPDLRRVFAYHGAEHKTVNAYENGTPLEVPAVKRFHTAHVRCGTSFLFVVMVMAIIVFALVGLPSLWMMVLSRVVLIPVIAALGYEITYFGARHTGNVLVRVALAPGLWLQSLTTREPDDGQLEVAVTALKRVVETDLADESVPQSPVAS